MSIRSTWSQAHAWVWWRRLYVMTQKEFFQLARDLPLVLFLVYSFTLSVYIVGAGLTMQLVNATMLVSDADQSYSSRELVHRFQLPYFRRTGDVPRPQDGMPLLDESKAMVLLGIPPRFHDALRKGEPTAVQFLVDTTNALQGLSAASYASRIVGQFGFDAAVITSGTTATPETRGPQVTSEHRVLYNPAQNDTWFQSIAHLLRMITLFSVLLPAAALVREKERGTSEQLLVSPLSPLQILLSKVLGMTTIIVIATGVAVFGVMRPMFGVPMKGHLSLFVLLTALYCFATAGIGLVAATVSKNQAQVGMMTVLVMVPMLLLSGVTTPFEAMPGWVQGLMSISPLRYYVDITMGILLKGAGLTVLWKSVLAMAMLGTAFFGSALWRFRRSFA